MNSRGTGDVNLMWRALVNTLMNRLFHRTWVISLPQQLLKAQERLCSMTMVIYHCDQPDVKRCLSVLCRRHCTPITVWK
jgi:hypothetical protein